MIKNEEEIKFNLFEKENVVKFTEKIFLYFDGRDEFSKVGFPAITPAVNSSIVLLGESFSKRSRLVPYIIEHYLNSSQIKKEVATCFEVLELFNTDSSGKSSNTLIIQNYLNKENIVIGCKFYNFHFSTVNNQENLFKIFNVINDNDPNTNLNSFKKKLHFLHFSIEDTDNLINFIKSVYYLLHPQNLNITCVSLIKEISELLSVPNLDLLENEILKNKKKFAELLYSKIVEWLIKKLNIHFSSPTHTHSLFIYDSVGFSNEQKLKNLSHLIQNYSIEKIINLFNSKSILKELNEYKSQGIPTFDLDPIDNLEVINLFEQKGLFDIINNAINFPGRSISSTVQEKLSNNISLGPGGDNLISIHHSFGNSFYLIQDAVEENNFNFNQELFDLIGGGVFQKLRLNNTQKKTKCDSAKRLVDDMINIISHSEVTFFIGLVPPDEKDRKSQEEFQAKLEIFGLEDIKKFNEKKFHNKMSNKDFSAMAFVMNDVARDIIRVNTKNIGQKTLTNKIVNCLKENEDLEEALQEVRVGITNVFFKEKEYKAFLLLYQKVLSLKILQPFIKSFLAKKKAEKEAKKEEQKVLKAPQEINRIKTDPGLMKKKYKTVVNVLSNIKSPIEGDLLQVIRELKQEISVLKTENEKLKQKDFQPKPRNSTNQKIIPENTLNYEAEIAKLKKKIREQEAYKSKNSLLEEQLLLSRNQLSDFKKKIERKKKIIKTKKEENKILFQLFKNKKTEIQCIDALHYANSFSLKEKLLSSQNKEKMFIDKLDEIAQDEFYSDSSSSN